MKSRSSRSGSHVRQVSVCARIQDDDSALARGTLREWRAVLEREIADMSSPDERPDLGDSQTWEGVRLPFPVLDSE